MAMSWSTALGSQDDSLESLMARRRLENNGLLQIAQTQDQMKTSQMNRDTLTEERGARADWRQAVAKKLQDDTTAKQAEVAEEKAAKARVEGMLADPDAEKKYGKQVMDAIKLQVYAGVKPSVSLTEKDPQAADTMVDTYTYDKDGKPVVTGQIKKGSVAAKIPGDDGGDGPAPYFTLAQTAEGFRSFDNRKGDWHGGRLGDLKPGATAQEKMASAEAAVFQLGEVKRLFNPDWVGPAAGRYKSMQLAAVGERGEKGLAEMSAQVASLKNQIINLRTGAAMSEPEAQRIMQEIPDMNNPPDVFLSRLETTQKNIEFLNSRRKSYAYGTPGNAPQAGVTVPGPQKTDSGPVAVKAGTMVLDPNGKPQRAKKDTTLPKGWKLK
jgi:hypothetical protein